MSYSRRQFSFGVLTGLAFAGLALVKKLIAFPAARCQEAAAVA
jgi:hypothetical protein